MIAEAMKRGPAKIERQDHAFGPEIIFARMNADGGDRPQRTNERIRLAPPAENKI